MMLKRRMALSTTYINQIVDVPALYTVRNRDLFWKLNEDLRACWDLNLGIDCKTKPCRNILHLILKRVCCKKVSRNKEDLVEDSIINLL
jgi:hypothetical protein